VFYYFIQLDDVMPSPNQTVQNNYTHSGNPSSIPKTMPTSSHLPMTNTHSLISGRKSLSYPQLFAIHNEIVNEWCKEQWLTFVDDHTETYLTLHSQSHEFVTVQSAINQYHLTSGRTAICSLPECLLIRTESKTKTIFVPNSIISLDNLCDNHIAQSLSRYKLMAIVCHLNEIHRKAMFYKDFQSNSWYIYYDQSTLSPSHSNILSDEEQYQLESFIQQKHHIDPSKFTAPLCALCNHPIVYVYIPKKTHERE
jgi:hypothetical protein